MSDWPSLVIKGYEHKFPLLEEPNIELIHDYYVSNSRRPIELKIGGVFSAVEEESTNSLRQLAAYLKKEPVIEAEIPRIRFVGTVTYMKFHFVSGYFSNNHLSYATVGIECGLFIF